MDFDDDEDYDDEYGVNGEKKKIGSGSDVESPVDIVEFECVMEWNGTHGTSRNNDNYIKARNYFYNYFNRKYLF